jgi:hypothetical protein
LRFDLIFFAGYIEQGSLGDLLRDFPEAKAKFKECGYYSIKQKNYTNVITIAKRKTCAISKQTLEQIIPQLD